MTNIRRIFCVMCRRALTLQSTCRKWKKCNNLASDCTQKSVSASLWQFSAMGNSFKWPLVGNKFYRKRQISNILQVNSTVTFLQMMVTFLCLCKWAFPMRYINDSFSSDGVGRSGTYVLLDMVLNRMSKGCKEIDIAAALEHIRDQRGGMVQTKKQFEFCLTAVAEEVS